MTSLKTPNRGGNLLAEMDQCCSPPRDESAETPSSAARDATLPTPSDGVDDNPDVVMDAAIAADDKDGEGCWPCFSCAA